MTNMQVIVETTITKRRIGKVILALEPLQMLAWMKGTVEPYVRARASARFRGEGDDVTGRWAALSDATIDYRTSGQVDYGAGPINVRTGALEDYITNSNGQYASAGGDSLMTYPGNPPSGSNATGSLEDKMIAAQQGLTDPWTPARPVLGLNERDLAYVVTELELYIALA